MIDSVDGIYRKRPPSATPAAEHIYEVRGSDTNEVELLLKDEKDHYHSIAAYIYPSALGQTYNSQ